MKVQISALCGILLVLFCGSFTLAFANEPLRYLSDVVAECGHNECVCECTIWGGGHDSRLYNKETKTKFFAVEVSEMTPEACLKNNSKACLGYQGGAPETLVRGRFSDCEVISVPEARRCGLTPNQLAILIEIVIQFSF